MRLPSSPSLDSIRARLATTRERARRLMRFKLNRASLDLVRQALKDLAEAERLIEQPVAADKPHTLRAADACVDVAQWRLRGVEQRFDDGAL